MSEITWYCFARVLPKKGYKRVSDNDESFICYKDDEPLLVLRKIHRYHPLTVEQILRRIQLSWDEFQDLLQRCNTLPPPQNN